MVFFVYFQGDCANLEKFVPRRCRANPCGLTLTLLRKRPRYTSFESPWLHHKNTIHFVWYFFVYFQGDCANLEKFVPRRCRANPCGLTLRNVNKFTFFAITEASESLPTNPLGSTKKISYILYDIFYAKTRDFP